MFQHVRAESRSACSGVFLPSSGQKFIHAALSMSKNVSAVNGIEVTITIAQFSFFSFWHLVNFQISKSKNEGK